MSVHVCLRLCVSSGVHVCPRCWKGGLCRLDVHRGRVVARVPSEAGLGPGVGGQGWRVEAGAGGAAFTQLRGSWGTNGGPGKASSPGQPDWTVLASSTPPAPSSRSPGAVALKSGRAEVTRLWTPGQMLHFTEG